MVPVLETDRLVLRPRTTGDIDDFAAMDSDPQVRRFLPPAFRDGFDPAAYRAALPDRKSVV